MVASRTPKLIDTLRGYTPSALVSDLIAGVTVGLVALPLAMAFAISSGVPPQNGLYTAVIAGFLISALGGSRTQIGGPTGAFVVVVYGIVVQYGLEGLLLCTLMAGVMLVLLGVTGLGSAVNYIPRPVVIGFTNGIAVLIASTQIKDFFGLQIGAVPGDFVGRLEVLLAGAGSASLTATLLALGTLGLIIVSNVLRADALWGAARERVEGRAVAGGLTTFRRRFFLRVPGTILALLIGTLGAIALNLPVETIGSRFGGIPGGLPELTVPRFDPELMRTLLPSALTVAMLGAIESLMSAVVADRLSGDRHKPNVELVAQGIANIAAPLFGGLPATGAIARTATNVRSGATTPVAGMTHAVTLVAVLLFAAPLAQYIPLAVLAAILMIVAYNMSEWREIPKILRMSWASVAVWLTTFLLTVFADLTVAVEVGIVLAALLYIRKVAHTTTVARVTREYVADGQLHILQDKHIPEWVTVIRVHGPFLFGATEKLAEATASLDDLTPIVILRLRDMTAIDATGLLAFEDFAARLAESGRHLILCGARPQPARFMRHTEFERHIGAENICPNIAAALARADAVYHATPARVPEAAGAR